MKRGIETSIGDGIKAFLKQHTQENPYLSEIKRVEKEWALLKWKEKVYDKWRGTGTALSKDMIKRCIDLADFDMMRSAFDETEVEILENELNNILNS